MAITQESLANANFNALGMDEMTRDMTTVIGVLNTANLGELQYTEVAVSSAEILAMGSTPVSILPAAGVGKYYEWNMLLEYNHVSTAYTISDLYLYLDAPFVLIGKSLISSAGNKYVHMSSNSVDSSESTAGVAYKFPSTLNQPVNLSTYDSNDPTLGDGTILVKIWYKVKTFGTEL